MLICGIVGVVYGPNGPNDESLTPSETAELMFAGVEHRGKDAFGWMHLDANGKLHLEKYPFQATKGIDKGLVAKGIPDKVFWWVGHVRLATHGSYRNPHNNHPLVHGDWFGVHNGICYNYDEILKVTGRQKRAQVDSEAIFASLHHYGMEEGLDKLDALAAVVAVNRKEPDKVHLITLDANPLYVRRSKNGAHYFASCSFILDELSELGVEWAEEMFLLGDYQRFTIEHGLESEYVQWADPEVKAVTSSSSWWSSGSTWSGHYQSSPSYREDSLAGYANGGTTKPFRADAIECLLCGDFHTAVVDECPSCGAPDECLLEVEFEDLEGDEFTLEEKAEAYAVMSRDTGADPMTVSENGKVYHIVDGRVLTPADHRQYLEQKALDEAIDRAMAGDYE